MIAEVLVPGPAQAFSALLDVEAPTGQDDLPPLWHWLYLLERPRQADLGEDGHPVRGSAPSPPEPGMRRMFAGGRLRWHRPLALGRQARRTTSVISAIEKNGSSGRLVFVTVLHQVFQDGELAVRDEQDIVYRAATSLPSPPADREAGAHSGDQSPQWRIPITSALLFRFSALTYNAHRIHYDRDYCRDVAGYPGLVVHGPLQAMAMAEAGRRRNPSSPPGRFTYRLVSPLFDHQGMTVAAGETEGVIESSVRDDAGRVTARGRMC